MIEKKYSEFLERLKCRIDNFKDSIANSKNREKLVNAIADLSHWN
jgi:hypothetical protein